MLASFLSVALLLAQGHALNLRANDASPTFTSSVESNYTSTVLQNATSAIYSSSYGGSNYTSTAYAYPTSAPISNYTGYPGATSTRYIIASTATASSYYSCWYEYGSSASLPAATPVIINGTASISPNATASVSFASTTPDVTTTISETGSAVISAPTLSSSVVVNVTVTASSVLVNYTSTGYPVAVPTSVAYGRPTKFGNQTVSPTSYPGDVNGTLVCLVSPDFNSTLLGNSTFNSTSEQLNSNKTGAGVRFEAGATAAFAVVLAAFGSLL